MHDRIQVHPRGRVLAAVLSGMLVMSTLASSTFAQPQASAEASKPLTEEQKRDAARTHYEAGSTKLKAQDYSGALMEFEAANNLIPTPQAQEKIALCYDGMKNTAKAIAAYESFIAKAKDSPRLEAEVKAAKERLEALKKAPVSVRVFSDPPAAQLEINGETQMGSTPIEVNLPPGTHKVKVSATGFDTVEKEIEIKAGDAPVSLSFSLTEAGEPVAGPVVATTPTTPPPTSEIDSGERSNLPAYITLGVAGAGAILGTVFGLKALSDKSKFNDDPTADRADKAERNALIADMSFGVAITLGITGTVLLLSNDDTGIEQSAKAPTQKAMQFSPFIGRSGGGAAATWRF